MSGERVSAGGREDRDGMATHSARTRGRCAVQVLCEVRLTAVRDRCTRATASLAQLGVGHLTLDWHENMNPATCPGIEEVEKLISI